MPTIRVDPGFRARPHQNALHRDLKRFNVIVAHRRFGKTVWCIAELIEAAMRNKLPAPRYAYIAPLLKQAKGIAWDYLKRYTEPIPGRTVNEAELRIDFLGRRITVYGADNPDALRGYYLDGVVLDEPAQMRPRVWPEIIRPTLADRKGWAIFIGTPMGRNEFWRLYDGALNGWPDAAGARTIDQTWHSAMFRASETGILPPDEIAAMRMTMSEDQAEQELECSFSAALLGAFYGTMLNDLERTGRIRQVDYDPSMPVDTAWDLGWTDDVAIWFYQRAPLGELRIIDFYEANKQPMSHYAKVLQDRGYVYGDHWFPHDAKPQTFAANGRSILQQAKELLKGGIREVPNLEVQDGIQAARSVLPRCWFDIARCHYGLEALRNYQREFDDELKVFKKAPRHDWSSHAADAFRYLAVSYRTEIGEQPQPFRGWETQSLDELWKHRPMFEERV